MSNLNPFEIRTEMLKLAKDYMDKQYEFNMQVAKQIAGINKEALEALPTMYTVDELLEKAKEMYSFVSKKD